MKKSIPIILLTLILLVSCSDDKDPLLPELPSIHQEGYNNLYDFSIEQHTNNETEESVYKLYLDCHYPSTSWVENPRIIVNGTIELDATTYFKETFYGFLGVYDNDIEEGEEIQVEMEFDIEGLEWDAFIEYWETHFSREDWQRTAEALAIAVGRNDAAVFDIDDDGDEFFYRAEQDANGWNMSETVESNWNSYLEHEYCSLHWWWYFEKITNDDKVIMGWDDWQEEYQSRVNQDFGGDEIAFWESQLLDVTRTAIDSLTGQEFEYPDKDFDFEKGFHPEWSSNRDSLYQKHYHDSIHESLNFNIRKPYAHVSVTFPSEQASFPDTLVWELPSSNMMQQVYTRYNIEPSGDYGFALENLYGDIRSWVVNDTLESNSTAWFRYFSLYQINYFVDDEQQVTGIFTKGSHKRYFDFQEPLYVDEPDFRQSIHKYIDNMQ